MNEKKVLSDTNNIKPLCSPLLCVTYLQSSNLKRYHSKLLKSHNYGILMRTPFE